METIDMDRLPWEENFEFTEKSWKVSLVTLGYKNAYLEIQNSD